MKFKKGVEIESDNFWYDLFDGGYIKPEKLLESESDIDKVNDAINTLKEFYNSAEGQDVLIEI